MLTGRFEAFRTLLAASLEGHNVGDQTNQPRQVIRLDVGEPSEPMKKSPALQNFKRQDLEVQMLDDLLDELCLQNRC